MPSKIKYNKWQMPNIENYQECQVLKISKTSYIKYSTKKLLQSTKNIKCQVPKMPKPNHRFAKVLNFNNWIFEVLKISSKTVYNTWQMPNIKNTKNTKY